MGTKAETVAWVISDFYHRCIIIPLWCEPFSTQDEKDNPMTPRSPPLLVGGQAILGIPVQNTSPLLLPGFLALLA